MGSANLPPHAEIDALREENAQLRELVIHLSKLVIKNVVDPKVNANVGRPGGGSDSMMAANRPANNFDRDGTYVQNVTYPSQAWAGGVQVDELPVILIVEDDPPIQSIIEDVLGEGGFVPAITASGEEAVTLLRGNKGKYRALVADIALRGKMSGWEVATQAREIDPEFPVVYITGAYAHQWVLRGVPDSIILEKPFAPDQLVTAVTQLLNADTLTK